MTRANSMVMSAICLSLLGADQGQVGPRRGGGRLNQRFSRESPAVGDRLPHVSGYDAEGRPFELENLQGSYTVLVFGCLT